MSAKFLWFALVVVTKRFVAVNGSALVFVSIKRVQDFFLTARLILASHADIRLARHVISPPQRMSAEMSRY